MTRRIKLDPLALDGSRQGGGRALAGLPVPGYFASAADCPATAAELATEGRPSGASASLFTPFLEANMPLSIIALHLLCICAAIYLLALLVGTGNWHRLYGAALWLACDLLVSVIGTVLSLTPDYHRLYGPALLKVHFALFGACVVLMVIEAARAAHPLSAWFAVSFGGYFACRCLQWAAIHWSVLPSATVEAINGGTYLLAVAVMVWALLYRVPPATSLAGEVVQQQTMFAPVAARMEAQ